MICLNRFVALNYLFGFSKEIRVFVHSHILFNFQVPCEIPVDLARSYWLLSSEVAVFRDSFVIISCRFLFVKRFFEVFWKSFLRKLSASQQTFHRTSQTLFSRIVHRYNFQASRLPLDWGLNPCLTRQLVYNTTVSEICQRFFEDLENWVKMENFRVRICGNSSISFRKAVKKV